MYRAEGLFLSKMNVFISITKRSKRVNLVLVQHLSAVIWKKKKTEGNDYPKGAEKRVLSRVQGDS